MCYDYFMDEDKCDQNNMQTDDRTVNDSLPDDKGEVFADVKIEKENGDVKYSAEANNEIEINNVEAVDLLETESENTTPVKEKALQSDLVSEQTAMTNDDVAETILDAQEAETKKEQVVLLDDSVSAESLTDAVSEKDEIAEEKSSSKKNKTEPGQSDKNNPAAISERSSGNASEIIQKEELTIEKKPAGNNSVDVQTNTEASHQKIFLNELKRLSEIAILKKKKIRDANIEKILNTYSLADQFTNKEIQKLLKVSAMTAFRYLKSLCKRGQVIKFASGRGTYYRKV